MSLPSLAQQILQILREISEIYTSKVVQPFHMRLMFAQKQKKTKTNKKKNTEQRYS